MPLGRTHKEPQITRTPPARAFVRWGTLLRILKPLLSAGKISVEGIDVQEIEGGVHLRAKPGEQANDHPWMYRRYTAGTTGREFQLTAGTINGAIPSNMAEVFTPPETGVFYVWAKASLNGDGFVNGRVLQSGTNPPTPTDEWFNAGGAPPALYLPIIKVTTDGGATTKIEQVENRGRSVVRYTVYMNCTESKYAVYWH